MTETEHLLSILGEEGVEVAQRTSKANRFGLDEIQPGQEFDNADRIMHEYAEMTAVYEMLELRGLLPTVDPSLVMAKKAKVISFLEYSRKCGTLQDDPPDPRKEYGVG